MGIEVTNPKRADGAIPIGGTELCGCAILTRLGDAEYEVKIDFRQRWGLQQAKNDPRKARIAATRFGVQLLEHNLAGMKGYLKLMEPGGGADGS